MMHTFIYRMNSIGSSTCEHISLEPLLFFFFSSYVSRPDLPHAGLPEVHERVPQGSDVLLLVLDILGKYEPCSWLGSHSGGSGG